MWSKLQTRLTTLRLRSECTDSFTKEGIFLDLNTAVSHPAVEIPVILSEGFDGTIEPWRAEYNCMLSMCTVAQRKKARQCAFNFVLSNLKPIKFCEGTIALHLGEENSGFAQNVYLSVAAFSLPGCYMTSLIILKIT